MWKSWLKPWIYSAVDMKVGNILRKQQEQSKIQFNSLWFLIRKDLSVCVHPESREQPSKNELSHFPVCCIVSAHFRFRKSGKSNNKVLICFSFFFVVLFFLTFAFWWGNWSFKHLLKLKPSEDFSGKKHHLLQNVLHFKSLLHYALFKISILK